MTDKLSYAVLETNAATQQHINLVRVLLRKMAVEILIRGEVHDISKFSAEEAETFAEFTPKLKASTYGSYEYKGFLAAMGPALQAHYRENSHHPEHFVDGIEGMNLVDLLEMFLDWLASTKRHADGDIMKSIDINRDRFKMDLQLVRIFQNTVKDFFPDELKSNASDPEEDEPESIFSEANKQAGWDKAYALIVADVGEKEAASMLARAASVAAQATPYTAHEPEILKPRPTPFKVDGPNTWVCQDCLTEQPPPSVDDFCCQSKKNEQPCRSEDIFDMNEPSWPCTKCRLPAVTYRDMEAEVPCEECWNMDPDAGFIGL